MLMISTFTLISSMFPNAISAALADPIGTAREKAGSAPDALLMEVTIGTMTAIGIRRYTLFSFLAA